MSLLTSSHLKRKHRVFTFSKKQLILFGVIIAFVIGLFQGNQALAAGPMVVDSFDGPITQNEINSFKSYIQTVEPVVWPNTGSMQSEYAQGKSGENIKAMGLMYELTNDTEILDRMIYFCDVLLSQRNDILPAPYGQRTVWTNTIAPVWPGNNTGTASADSANGDSIGHLAYCGRLILQTPAISNTTVPIGDAYGHGATYLQRANTFITEADYVVSQFLFPKLLDLSRGNKLYFQTQSPYMPGGVFPWNQQMMITYGLQNLAAAHAIKGDNPSLVSQYDGIVQTNLNWFFSDNSAKQTYTDSKGNTAYNWGYNPTLLGGEDSNHGALDVSGFYRAFLIGRYGITASMMTPFANMYADVMMRGPGDYAGRVDGTDGTGHGAPTTYPRSGNLQLAALRPDVYYTLANATMPNMTSTTMASFARLMYVKNQRYTGSDTQAPTTPTNLTASAASSSQVNLSWTASTDNVAVTGYNVYRGATLVGTSTTTSYSDTGLSASTAYSYTVKAKDAAANVSAASNTASATTLVSSGDLALGKTYSASTTWSTSYLGDKAFDGDAATRWSASSGSFNNQWINVDFGTPTAYNQVVIKEISFPRVTAYKLQSSTDGTTYTDISGTTGTTIGANKSISFSNVSSRYLRLYITSASNIPNIEEMEVYGTSGTDSTAPSAPSNLTANAASSSQINLSWSASTDNVGVTGYNIYRGATLVGTSTTTSYNDTGLTASTAYSYTVKAKDAATNLSVASNTASATTQAPSDTQAPTTPTGLTATAASNSQINLSWTASTDNVGVTEYNVYRDGTLVGSSTSPSYSDTGLSASTAYSYTVRAEDAAANLSAASNTANATTQSGGGNLALGKTYNASTIWSATYPGANAFDGSSATRWSASSGSLNNQWVSVDLGAATSFNQVVIKEITFQRVTAFKLQSSSDGTTYTDIAGTSGTTIGASKTINFTGVNARYLRLYVTTASAVPTIDEIEVYNNNGNLALGKTYNASTIWNASYPAANAFDGDTSNTSRWSASSGSLNNQWISVDFGAANTYNQVVIKEITFQRITSFKLQSSTDGTTYSDISGTSGTAVGANKTINFSPVSSRYLRILISTASDTPTINEMEVYNQ
ncbi:discoidin domain-containing protein [Paenibacillus sp. 2RAB27]|uniref:discoidin domain-containing protein n=1 Tax=Paenibacillus sp. 2RAB27 TaxID=3232991 RepID=UPI003F986699